MRSNFQGSHNHPHLTSPSNPNSILFHQIETHHPFQPKKSMINKLPGSQNIQLSAHPEIVLFFQAAQIERLSRILNEYKGQQKQGNKINLDRHSYEVQIKELSTELMRIKQEIIGNENYIKEQNKVLEELGRKRQVVTSEYGELVNKYERALMEIDKMYTYNENITTEINKANRRMEEVEEESKRKEENRVQQINQISNQLQRLTMIIKEKQSLIKQMKGDSKNMKFKEEENEKLWERKKAQYEKHLQESQNKIKFLEQQKLSDYHLYHTKVSQIQNELSRRTQQYTSLIDTKEKQVQSLKNKTLSLTSDLQLLAETSQTRIKQLQCQVFEFPKKYEQKREGEKETIEQLTRMMEKESKQIMERIDEMERKMKVEWTNSKSDVNQVKVLIAGLIKNMDSFNHEIMNKINSHAKLVSMVQEKDEQIKRLNIKMQSYTQDSEKELSLVKQEHLKKQIQMENSLSFVKQQLVSFKKTINGYEIKLAEETAHTRVLEQKMHEAIKQKDSLQKTLNKKNQIISELQVSDKYGEVERAYGTIEEYKSQLQMLEKEMQQKLDESLYWSEVANNYKSKDQNVKSRIKEIKKRLETIIKIYEKEENSLRSKVSQFQSVIIKLQQQKQLLTQAYQQEIDALRTNSISPHLFQQQQHKIFILQKSYKQLQAGMQKVKEENYRFQCQAYEGNTEEYVRMNFSLMKIEELKKEIDRVEKENLQLKEENICWKLQIADKYDNYQRKEENLATLVLAFAEIQSLRNQLKPRF